MQWTWKNFKSIKEAVNAKTGGLADSFLNADTKEVAIQNADVMAVWLQYYAQKNIPITIIGDYDADGVHCASAEMWMLLSALGASKIRVRLPRRFSEGYGLSPKIVGEIEKGVIVTVDNGIAALEAVSDAKAKGLVVLVIDHHLPQKGKWQGCTSSSRSDRGSACGGRPDRSWKRNPDRLQGLLRCRTGLQDRRHDIR